MRRHRIRRCNADRLEWEATTRLLKAIFAQPIEITLIPEADPPISPFSIVWSLADPDPRRWN